MIIYPNEHAVLDKQYDVCIVGAGPTGISLALELQYCGLRVCVMESGFEHTSEEFSYHKLVTSTGIKIREDSRERLLGGTSQTWGGLITPLDPIDFRPRSEIHDGWPIPQAVVTQALDSRGYRYGFPPSCHFTYEAGAQENTRLRPLQDLDPKVFLFQTPPIQYGKRYRYAFLGEDVDLLLDATAVELENSRSAGVIQVSRIAFKSSRGVDGCVVARHFVLAAGAIETIRLLFNSRTRTGTAIGNEHDQLGRYFMNHPKGYCGFVRFREPLPLNHELFLQNHDNLRGFSKYVGLRLNEELQLRQGVLNSYVRPTPELLGDSGREFTTARDLSRQIRATRKNLRGGRFREAARTALQSARKLHGLPAAVLLKLYRHRLKRQRVTFVSAARVRCFVEMEPQADNRILGDGPPDQFGIPTTFVHHDLTKVALDSVSSLLDSFGTAVVKSGLGTFSPSDEPLRDILATDASHHMGGTCMGNDPRRSVVDRNLRVHGTDNLYVVGGAVFPTGGCANPTMTMIGLSIRLAENLKKSMVGPIQPAATEKKTGVGVIVIGAGRRVAKDVVPAIEALAPEAHVQAVFATRPGTVFGRKSAHDVWPLSEINGAGIAKAKLIYLAVPRTSVDNVLQILRHFDCGHIQLVIDTPVVEPTAVKSGYEGFGNIHVAEDSIYLPWLTTVRAALSSDEVDWINMDRSAFRYHAIALSKAIVSGSDEGRAKIVRSSRWGAVSKIHFKGGARLTLIGPRDYDTGVLTIETRSGTVIASSPVAGAHEIGCILDGLHCTGFALMGTETHLHPSEVGLLGKVTPADTIITRMHDLKRVGLYRLLKDVINGNDTYALAEGLEDTRIASKLRRYPLSLIGA